MYEPHRATIILNNKISIRFEIFSIIFLTIFLHINLNHILEYRDIDMHVLSAHFYKRNRKHVIRSKRLHTKLQLYKRNI